MSQTSKILKIELHDFWHVGTGEGRGSGEDSVVKLKNGLPYLPGRELKGILKVTAKCLESWGHITVGDTERLFGDKGNMPANIQITGAELNKKDAEYLMSLDANHQTRQALFDSLSSTAINYESGNATHKSLRSMEIVIPCVLQAEITFEKDAEINFKLIQQLLPLTRAIGSNRKRGLGRCTMTFKTKE